MNNKEEKNLFEEVWNAVGLGLPKEEPPKAPKEEPKIEAAPEVSPEPKLPAAPSEKEEKTEETPIETPKEEEVPAANAPKEEAPAESAMGLVQEKKKDIRFLIVYTVAFVVVISFLIGGSYLITSRIRREMAANNQELNTNQSTLKNIQVENQSLREENTLLAQRNDELLILRDDANALTDAVGDMIEQGEYLAAAQDAYIRGDDDLAETILATVERDKLSEPAKAYYDTLSEELS